ncbi:AraC family transcriptional regulator [Tenacibaculum singaporense]|nr:AraC family transcriptional regulator [Tenacibaculum singaporense]
MKTEHILILLICGLGVIHGFILGLYLLTQKDIKLTSNKILGVLLILFGIRISKSIFLYFTVDLDYILITLGLTIILLLGPLFYFYTKSFLLKSFKIEKKLLIHGIPFLVFFILNSFKLLTKDFYVSFGIYLIYLHFLVYILASFFLKKSFVQKEDTLTSLKKTWLTLIHIGIIFIWASYFFFLLGDTIPYILGPLIYSVAIYSLSLWAIINKALKEDDKKYQSSSLNNEKSKEIFTQLEYYFQNEKPFLNPDLKLQMVASKLNVTSHSLSQSVNENCKQNFQQYLNSYRIKEAKEILLSEKNKKITISSIAYDCGFNSISAFNTAFKKIVNQTPSQFKKTESN